jgi:D-alanyl-D-alanine carboxypeptidase
VRMLLTGGGSDAGPALLTEASFERFTRPVIDVPDEPAMSYAYGLDVLDVDGHTFLRHSGGMVGYYALMECDTEAGVGAIMMVNGHADRRPVVRYALSVLRAWKERRNLPDVPPTADPYVVANAGDIEGRYRNGAREVVLRADGGRLLLAADGVDVTLEPDPETPERFAVPHPALDRFALAVERDEGKIVSLACGPHRFVREGGAASPEGDAPQSWTAITGLYRAYNPWFPAFRVYVRGGQLFLSGPEGEEPVDELDDGEFRVGGAWSPDRVSFGTVLEGRAHAATYNGQPFWRSFEE